MRNSAINSKTDSSFKRTASRLADKYTWLRSISDALNINQQLKTITADALKKQKTEYTFDPLQYDIFIDNHSARLDRCLAYRREFFDLAGSAVKQCEEYEQFESQRDILKELELNRWV